MHEMGIATEIARIVEEEARANGAQRILEVRLRVGRWSGVEAESLRFCLEALAEGTLLADSRLEIETVEPRFRCGACAHQFPAAGYFDPCPRCGECGGELLGGDELNVTEIEVE